MMMSAAMILMVYCVCLAGSNIREVNAGASGNVVTIQASPDLMGVVTSWAEQYELLHPETIVIVESVTDGNIQAKPGEKAPIGIVSADYLGQHEKPKAWSEVLGREVVVGVMNASNPLLADIDRQGVSAGMLAMAASSGQADWSLLTADGKALPLRIAAVRDGSTEQLVANFLGSEFSPDHISLTDNPAELMRFIRENPGAVGFCRLTDIVDPSAQEIAAGLRLLPFDKNGNGQMDSYEMIYKDLNTLTRGLWIGKYPKALVSGIFAISVAKPENDAERAFLKWILTDGQQYLATAGYWGLASAERQSGLERLAEQAPAPEVVAGSQATFRTVIIILMVSIVLGLIIEAVVLYRRYAGKETVKEEVRNAPVFGAGSVRIPGGLMYDRTHTWAFMEQDGTVRIGLDDFIPHITGTITGLKMKKTGETIKKGEAILTIMRNGKQLIIKAPVSGTITSCNKALLHNASLLNSSPYSDGWIYLIQPSNWLREIQFLFMADRFSAWIKGEYTRLKDFLAFISRSGEPRFAHVVLQEGGEVREGFLEELGPEAWEDFQVRFMDTAV